MISLRFWCLAVSLVLFIIVQESIAGYLQDDYKAIEVKREKLETKRTEYETRFETVASEVKTKVSDLRQCAILRF